MRRVTREALAGLRLLRANFRRLPKPLKVNLCVTFRCQYHCRTCEIWRRTTAGELSIDELLQFVAANREVAWLDVCGGEVFLRPDLGELFDAIAKSWRSLALLHFATNGYLPDRIVSVTERLMKSLAGRARVIVTVSVDGDEPLNDEIRGMPGGFRRQIATFKALRRIPGVEVAFGMTLSRYNVRSVERTLLACQQACPGVAAGDLHLNVAQRSGHYYGNLDSDDVLAPRQELHEAIERHRRGRGLSTSLSAWVETRYLRVLEGFVRDGFTSQRCHALRSSCFVDPQGTVFPCISYARPLGSLRETGMALGPIWSSASSRDLQRDIWMRRCPRCWTACEAYPSILGNMLRPGAA